jgi:two-component system capsular synthesis sensor histidine kinase RcsC
VKNMRDIEKLGRYQRHLLWGGGALLTVAILAAATLAILTTIQGYFADEKTTYLTQKTLLMLEIESQQTALRGEVLDAEIHWGTQAEPSAALSTAFVAAQGRLLIQRHGELASQILIGGNPDKASFFSGFGAMLSLSEMQRAGHALSTMRPGQRPFSGYFFNPERTFLSILPPLGSTNEIPLNATSPKTLIDHAVQDTSNFYDREYAQALKRTRYISWFAPKIDRLTGEDAFQLMQPAFAGSYPFVVFVSTFPRNVFVDQLRKTSYDGTFMIVNRQGGLIFDTWYRDNGATDATLAQRVLRSGAWNENLDSSQYFYINRTFTISEPLSDTGWIFAYAYSWQTILAAHWPTLAGYIAGMLLLLLLLWGLVYFFDRKIFTPMLERSERVFDSENLNRTIIATAPFGLGLLLIKEETFILQNSVMQSYESVDASLAGRLLALRRAHAPLFSKGEGESSIHEMFAVDIGGEARYLLVNILESKYLGNDVLLCNFTDITARKQIESALSDAKKAADVANLAKSSFLATISHEIRTPLNGILGNLELLLQTRLDDRQQDRVHRVENSSRSLLTILNDILDFSKIESGQMTLEAITFDLWELVGQVVADFSPVAHRKNLRLYLVIPPDMPGHFVGDPTRLKQILFNLIGNALKFTSHGAVGLVVSGTAGEQTTTVSFNVIDTGIGIGAHRQQQLFQPFVQADDSTTRLYGGTGLGLALCKRVVELMRGSISLSSVENQGSTFSVSVPLEQVTSPPRIGMKLQRSDITLVLFCSIEEWLPAIKPHLEALGIPVEVIHSNTASRPANSPLIVVGERCSRSDELIEIKGGAPWIVELTEDGPAMPIRGEYGAVVSIYAMRELTKLIVSMVDSNGRDIACFEKSVGTGERADNHDVRILIVDDNPVNLTLLGEQLESLGYFVTSSSNVSDALMAYHQAHYDIILTDLGMPVVDGYTFAKILRGQGVRTPIVAVTAHALFEEHEKCRAVGINDVLVKPASLAALADVIQAQVSTGSRVNSGLPIAQRLLSPELIAVLNTSTRNSMQIISGAFEKAELTIIAAEVHSIKGTFSSVHEVDVVEACREIEMECAARNMPGLRASIDDAFVVIEDVLSRLHKQ